MWLVERAAGHFPGQTPSFLTFLFLKRISGLLFLSPWWEPASSAMAHVDRGNIPATGNSSPFNSIPTPKQEGTPAGPPAEAPPQSCPKAESARPTVPSPPRVCATLILGTTQRIFGPLAGSAQASSLPVSLLLFPGTGREQGFWGHGQSL